MRDGDGATHLVSRPRHSCYRCGNPKHVADSCPHKDKQCNKCGKTGHLARACKSKSEPAQKSRKAFKSKGTHVLQAGTDDEGSSDDEDDFLEPDPGLHKVRQDSRYRKLTTSLKLNGVCVKFEVDTGAELSTIPMAVYHAKLPNSTIHPSSVTLRQYDGTVLPTVGEIMVTVSHGQQVINGSFIIVENADTQLPLLGRDWLYQLHLDRTKLIRTCKRGDPRVHSVQQAVWLSKYPDVTKEELGLLKGIEAEMELKPGTSPKFCKSTPVPFALREQVEKAIQQQVADGELEPVEYSDWAAPIVVVHKKDGGIRICADFKMTVNLYLQTKTFPLPTTDEVFSMLAQGESFSTLDLARAYKQMVVAPDSRACLTINTPLGLFRYRRLPFGIATAPAIWQKAMSMVLQGCKGVVYYIDDILVTGKTRVEHEHNLQMVFRRLQQFGLRIKLSKCQFFQDSVIYLGHKITCEGIQPTQERIRAVKEAPTPQNKTELKSFLGMMTYNVRFLRFLPDIMQPLYQLVKMDVKWIWHKKHDKAFQEAKKLVSTAPVLAHYDADKPVKLYCDASPRGVGACLMHIIDGQEKPVAYASRTLTPAEVNYAQIEREALAIVFAVRKFHQYLYGRQFTLVTDHRPLCRILGHDQGIPTLAAARM